MMAEKNGKKRNYWVLELHYAKLRPVSKHI